MLSCKQVATLASQYLDKDTSTALNWQIRLHLMMCANCRRFVKHLKITQTVAKKIDLTDHAHVDSEIVWKTLQEKIQLEKSKNTHNPNNKS